MEFTHFNDDGRAVMVDVSAKDDSARVAVAQAVIRMNPETLLAIRSGGIKKGDVLAVAQVAGIMGAKQTPSVIPMCHPLMLTSVNIKFTFDDTGSAITIQCEAKTNGKTGVEMEAITGATIAALTVYDMCKAIDRWMEISDIKLLEKRGGKSGELKRDSRP